MASDLSPNRLSLACDSPHAPAWLGVEKALLGLPPEQREFLQEVFFEFDEATTTESTAIPSIFLTFSDLAATQSLEQRLLLTQDIARLPGFRSGSGLSRFRKRIIELDLTGINLQSCGFMLSREPAGVRINLGVKSVQAFEGLVSAFALAQADKLVDACHQMLEAGALTILALDLSNGVVMPLAGLEIGWPDQHSQQVLPKALAWLQGVGVLCPEKHQALETFEQLLTPLNASAPWPTALVIESMFAPADRFSVVQHSVTHLKLSFTDGGAPQAKAYLACSHALATVDQLSSAI